MPQIDPLLSVWSDVVVRIHATMRRRANVPDRTVWAGRVRLKAVGRWQYPSQSIFPRRMNFLFVEWTAADQAMQIRTALAQPMVDALFSIPGAPF